MLTETYVRVDTLEVGQYFCFPTKQDGIYLIYQLVSKESTKCQISRVGDQSAIFIVPPSMRVSPSCTNLIADFKGREIV